MYEIIGKGEVQNIVKSDENLGSVGVARVTDLALAEELVASAETGKKVLSLDKLVDRFLAWPLPESVCADLCATRHGDRHRMGTNLLSAIEARQMLEYLLKSESV